MNPTVGRRSNACLLAIVPPRQVGWADVPVVACETLGADSFSQSFKAGQLVTLPGITSLATTLGAKVRVSTLLRGPLFTIHKVTV